MKQRPERVTPLENSVTKEQSVDFFQSTLKQKLPYGKLILKCKFEPSQFTLHPATTKSVEFSSSNTRDQRTSRNISLTESNEFFGSLLYFMRLTTV